MDTKDTYSTKGYLEFSDTFFFLIYLLGIYFHYRFYALISNIVLINGFLCSALSVTDQESEIEVQMRLVQLLNDGSRETDADGA